jgi:hypothetical protein
MWLEQVRLKKWLMMQSAPPPAMSSTWNDFVVWM